MVTRSNAGIFKKKIYTVSTVSSNLIPISVEPSNVQEAMSSPEWKKAMTEEFNALMQNQIWTLVSPNDQMKVVDNK